MSQDTYSYTQTTRWEPTWYDGQLYAREIVNDVPTADFGPLIGPDMLTSFITARRAEVQDEMRWFAERIQDQLIGAQ